MARKSWWQRHVESKRKSMGARGEGNSPPPFIASFATRDPSQRLPVRASPSMHATNPPFLKANLDLGYLARELKLLRDHNLTFQQDDPQETMLMFSEGALVLITMERFLRTILGNHVGPGQTLPNLLELAFSDRISALDPPGGDRAQVTKLVTDIRNALLHANFEQAARQSCHHRPRRGPLPPRSPGTRGPPREVASSRRAFG